METDRNDSIRSSLHSIPDIAKETVKRTAQRASHFVEEQEKSPWRLDVILYILAALVSLYAIIHVDISHMLIPLLDHPEGGFLTQPGNDTLLRQAHICRVYDTEETEGYWIKESINTTHQDDICGLMRRKADTKVHLSWQMFKLHYYRVTHVDYGNAHYFSGSAVGVRVMIWANPQNTSELLGAYIHTGFGLMFARGITHDVDAEFNDEGDILSVRTSQWTRTMGFPHYNPGFRKSFRLFKIMVAVMIKMTLQVLCLIELCILIRLMWTHKGSVFSQALPAMACSYRTKTQVGLLVAQTIIALEEALAVYGSWVIQDWNTGMNDAIYMANFLRGVVLVLLLINDYTIRVLFTIGSIESGRFLLTVLLVPATTQIAHVMFAVGLTTYLESHNYAFASVLGHSVLLGCIALLYLILAALACRVEYVFNKCKRQHWYQLAGNQKSTYRSMAYGHGLIKTLTLGRHTQKSSKRGLPIESGVNIWCDGYIVYQGCHLICMREFNLYQKYLFIRAKPIKSIELRIYGNIHDGHLFPPKAHDEKRIFEDFNSKDCSVQDLA